jgi:anti-repressor protein
MGREQQTTLINESGVYSLVFGSTLETAKQFKKWVTSEVLPAIRKSGGYIAANIEDTPEIIMARGMLAAADAIERLKSQLEAKTQQIAIQESVIKEQAPKVEYHDEVLNAAGLINTTVIAKDLGMSAGALNKHLHKAGIIYRSGDTWVPYSKYQDKGLCRSKTFPYVDSNGKNQTAIHFYWTEKGRELIMNRFAKPVNA